MLLRPVRTLLRAALTQMPQDLGNAGSEGCGMEPKLKAWEPDYGEEKTWATPESACPASWPRGPTCERGANPLILPMLAVRWIAIRNLIISVPNLLLSFATWLVWSMIVAKIQKLHDKDPTVYDFGEHGRLQPAVLAGLRLHPMACCS